MKRAYCLYRVSTKNQVDVQKDDIPMQKIACHEFAKAHGWVIAKEFSEKGVSGFKVSADERDAIQSLKTAALNKEFEILLVFMFDRIGRIDNETPFVVEWFASHGIEVWSVNEGQQQFNDHTDKLMNYIRYWQASGESAKTSVRIKTRMHQLVEEGYFTRGVVPFGYDLAKKGRLNKKGNEVGDLVVNEEEAYYVRKVFEQCVREGKGSHVLAEYLNKNGVRTHNGAKFQATTILQMLANKTYCGYYVTGEISSKKIEDIAKVDEEIWNRAQDFLEQRKRVNEEKRRICRKTQGQVLLSGNIFCAECGGRMVSTSYNSKYIRKDGNVSEYHTKKYMCYHRARKLNECSSQVSYDAYKIDNAITEIVEKIFKNIVDTPETEVISKRLEAELTTAKTLQKKYQLSIEKLNEQLSKLQMEIGKSLVGESLYSAEDISATINSTKQRIAEETEKLIEVTQIVAKGYEAVEDIKPMYTQFVSWAEEFRRATLEQKRMILSQLIDCVEIGRGYEIRVKINGSYEQFCGEWVR